MNEDNPPSSSGYGPKGTTPKRSRDHSQAPRNAEPQGLGVDTGGCCVGRVLFLKRLLRAFGPACSQHPAVALAQARSFQDGVQGTDVRGRDGGGVLWADPRVHGVQLHTPCLVSGPLLQAAVRGAGEQRARVREQEPGGGFPGSRDGVRQPAQLLRQVRRGIIAVELGADVPASAGAVGSVRTKGPRESRAILHRGLEQSCGACELPRDHREDSHR